MSYVSTKIIPAYKNLYKSSTEIDSAFEFSPATGHLVMQNMKIINPKKAIGCNNIPHKLIYFLTSFKFSDVSHIFKSGNEMNKGSFCPVSILSILSTLNKGFLNDEMLDHFRIFQMKCSTTFVKYSMS